MLGMKVDITTADDIQIRNLPTFDTNNDDVFNDEVDSDSENSSTVTTNTTECAAKSAESEEILQDFNVLSNVTGTLELQDYSKNKIDIQPNSPFTVVTDSQ